MFYTSHQNAEKRAFDHLYDPVYQAGSGRDIEKENVRALVKTAPAKIFTNYGSMFSEIATMPRTFSTLQHNPLPRIPSKASTYRQ